MKPFHKKKAQHNCNNHAQKEEKGNFLIILTDREIEHRIKGQHQRHESTVTRENINDIHLSHQKFVDTEGNPHHGTEHDIQKQPHIITWKNILIPFLIDHIRHVS